jgi:deoxyribodipyrimidine photolyase-related protein
VAGHRRRCREFDVGINPGLKPSNARPRGPNPAETLVLILGDQLTPTISSLEGCDQATTMVLLVEVAEETTYVPHHKKKIAFILSAMRHFAVELRQQGWQVDYVELDDPENTGSFTGELHRAVHRHRPKRIVVTEAGEYRVLSMQAGWQLAFNLPVEVLADTRFFWTKEAFAAWAVDRRVLRMEHFYHESRRATGYLLDEDAKPTGGVWNYDTQNRKPAKNDLFMPSVASFEPDAITRAVLDLVAYRFADHIGDLEPFGFAVTRDDALRALATFVRTALPSFGDFQDAMLRDQKFLYHSVLSPYINCGLLLAREVCDAAEGAHRSGTAPINAVEGFIRQIIGWREYVRGIYWIRMPAYLENNFFEADRPLPGFYWTGKTDMACLSAAIGQTIEEAYAHHIQRLMITGNFAMLAGCNPHEVHEWYLAVYADAYEWVEVPNVIGMSQFADGGLLASKPYAGGGNYINKMSDYCKSCAYDVKQRTGPNACPFNALYWHFLDRNRARLGGFQRLRTIYAAWDKMDPQARRATLSSADAFLAALK